MSQDPPEIQEIPAKTAREDPRERGALKDNQVCKDHSDQLVQLDQGVSLGHLEMTAGPAHQDHRDPKEMLERMVNRELRVTLVSPVQ